MMNNAIDLLENGIVPKAQKCNIRYLDLVDDPLAAAEKIYAQFGVPVTDEAKIAMQKIMDDNPRSRRPAHRYAVGSGQVVSKEREVFERYQKYFPYQMNTERRLLAANRLLLR